MNPIDKPSTSDSKSRDDKFHLAILVSHPIQYLVPLFRALHQCREIELTVIYCSRHGVDAAFDVGFGQKVQWDIPLLEGYNSVFLPNRSRRPGPGSFFGLVNPAIFAELRRKKPDAVLIHGYLYASYWLGFLAARLSGTPFWMRGDSLLLTPRSPLTKILKQIILRPLLRASQAGLYVGNRNREFYRHFGVPNRKLFFAPHSVDNDFFEEHSRLSAEEQNRFRQRFGIPQQLPVILSAGKLIAQKQPLHLLRAFEKLRARQPCALVFAGDGELRQAVEQEVLRREIPDVYITGFLNQTEMPLVYAIADVLVLPSSIGETWGLVVNEAMSCGLPIVVTNRVGCAADLVLEGENGFVVAWDDVNALDEALSRLVESPDLRAKFGARSLEIIRNYRLENTLDGIIQACRTAIPKNRRRESASHL